MAKFSLRQAAEQAGVSKSTILRAIQNGRLSAARTDDGGYAIDAAELCRVYGERVAQQTSNVAMGQDAPIGGTGATADDAAALRAEIAGLKAQLALMREQIDDTKDQRDKWQQQAMDAQRLLADQRPSRRGWFGLGRSA